MESTDISHSDIRIKESDNMSTSTVKSCMTSSPRKDSKKSSSSHSPQKRKNFCRSQSVSTPKVEEQKPELNLSYQCTSKQNLFSTMSDIDLEDWKSNITDSSVSDVKQEEPILTLASSFTDSSNVTIGFNVPEKKNE